MLCEFYNVLNVYLPEDDLPEVTNALRDRLDFLKFSNGSAQGAEIQFIPLAPDFAHSILPFRKRLKPYYIALHGGTPFMINYRHGRTVSMIEFGPELKIHVAQKGVSARHINEIMQTALHFAVRRRGGVIMKAAAAAKDGACLLLAGPPASCKTTFLMHLLDNGWKFVGNDHILVHDMHLHSIEKDIVYADFHVSDSPEIFSRLPNSPGKRLRRGLLKRSAMFIEKHSPVCFVNKSILNKLYSPLHSVVPEKLFPGCQRLNKVQPTHCAMLRPGSEFSAEPCTAEKAFAQLCHLIEGNYQTITHISHLVQVLTTVADHMNVPPLKNVLGEIHFHTVDAGVKMNRESREERFLEFAEQLLAERNCPP